MKKNLLYNIEAESKDVNDKKDEINKHISITFNVTKSHAERSRSMFR